MKSAASSHLHQEDDDDDVYEDLFARNGSSSSRTGETVKVEGKGSEQKSNTHRSKHSETEQRRRGKINERFQSLRDVIPQKDPKKDKASILLEAIEYVQFLQGKLRMYEGSCQGWVQEPAKLTPWRNHCGPAETPVEPPQIMKNGSCCENKSIAPSMLTNLQHPIEPHLGASAVYKAPDHPGAASSMVGCNMQTQSNLFSPGRGSCLSQALHDSTSDVETYRPQLQSWQGREYETENAVSDNVLNGQDSLSSAYSKGILCTLTQALRSSGVDLSLASISVKIDVGKRVSNGVFPVEGASEASSSKDNGMQYLNKQMTSQTWVQNGQEDTEQANKRLRTATS